MRKDYEKLFSHLKPVAVPPGLSEKIIRLVGEERRQRELRKKILASALFFAASLALIVPSLTSFKNGLSSSGTLQMFSLIFTDFSVVVANFGDFLMSVLEALPLFPMTAFFASALVFVVSFKILVGNARLMYGLQSNQ